MNDPAIVVWREKLAFLERELAIASNPAVRFQLTKQIEEAKAKIKELDPVDGTEPDRSESASPEIGSRTGVSSRNTVDLVIVTALEEERDAVLALLPDYQRKPPRSSGADCRNTLTTIPRKQEFRHSESS